MDAVSAVGDRDDSRGPSWPSCSPGGGKIAPLRVRLAYVTLVLLMIATAGLVWLHELAAGSHAKGGVECHGDVGLRRSFENDNR